ncbi:MAG: DUF4142 domain-containing protein [Actinomycetes bacterium]
MRLVRSVLAVLATAACAVVLTGAPATAAPSQQDQAWMVSAHQGNLTEIAAGQAAQQKAASDTVRRLGQMLVDDHQKLDQQLTAAAQQLGVSLPGSPSSEQQAELARVSAMSGKAFDTAWIASQIKGHRQTIALGERELANGSDATVKALAQAAAPVVKHHLDELLAASDQLGVPTSVPGGTGGQAATSSAGVGAALALAGVVVLLGSAVVARRRRS